MSDEFPPRGQTPREKRLDEMWQVFKAMGQGFEARLISSVTGPYIRCSGVGANGSSTFSEPQRAMKCLIAGGLARVSDRTTGAEDLYELTEAGRRLYEGYKHLPDAERESATTKRFKLEDMGQ
jgi:hypothetical protein